jgi:hypothetical protein
MLSEGIGGLTGLKNLDLYANEMMGPLPEALWSLAVVLPDGIGSLAALRELHLDYNALTTLPVALGRLRNLEVLELVDPLTWAGHPLEALADLQAREGLPALLAHLLRGPAE